MTRCKTSQCKRKQWCKRYQLYLQDKNKNIENIDIMSRERITEFNNLYEQTKLRQFIDSCEYFIPTEQSLIKISIKRKLDKLINKLNKLS